VAPGSRGRRPAGVSAAAVFFIVGRGRIRADGGRGLKHRFGPEYDRAVADHEGDT
jgi:hypothetical protein